MSKPSEHKTVHARILAYAPEIGWSLVTKADAELRRGKMKGGQECPPSLFFEDLLHAQVREFNPRYAEAEGAFPGKFRHLHTDIYGNREFTVRRGSNRRDRRDRRDRREDLDFESLSSLRSLRLFISEFSDHEEKRERDLILKRKRRLRGFPNAAFRPGISSPERLNHRGRRKRKGGMDSESLSSLRLYISGFRGLNCRDRKGDYDRSIRPHAAAMSSCRQFWHRLCQNRLLASEHFCDSLSQNFHIV